MHATGHPTPDSTTQRPAPDTQSDPECRLASRGEGHLPEVVDRGGGLGEVEGGGKDHTEKRKGTNVAISRD